MIICNTQKDSTAMHMNITMITKGQKTMKMISPNYFSSAKEKP